MRATRRRTRFRPVVVKNYQHLSLSQLAVPAKAINALEEVGVLTIDELLAMSLSDLAVVPNLGEAYVKGLVDALKKVGAVPPWTARAICRAMIKTGHPASKRKRNARRKKKKKKPIIQSGLIKPGA